MAAMTGRSDGLGSWVESLDRLRTGSSEAQRGLIMVGTHSETKVTCGMIGVVLALVGVLSVVWAVITGPSDDPWARTMVTCCGVARAYAADMEIEEPPAADFEPAQPEIAQPPPADFERSDPSIDDDSPADSEPAQPEIAQPPPADFESSTPELEEEPEE